MMNFKALALLLAAAPALAFAFEPITVADQGTFTAGGTVKTEPGTYDALHPSPAGQTVHGDHAAVRYQVPAGARRFPLVFLHGAGQSSRTWETTADGREGFATIFLRAGYPVYLIDQPRRGQAGRSTVPFEMKAAPDDQFWYGQFRIGLWPAKFEGSQFPKGGEALDRFFRQMTPDTGPWDRDAIASATAAVFDRSGPGILVTHSAGGGLGWLAALKTDRIRGVVSYEPGSGFVFPKGEAPEPIENSGYWGPMKPAEVPLEDFMKLTKYPIVIYYGDNIPKAPSSRPHQDYWRAAAKMAKLWCETVNRHGGQAKVVMLPEAGLRGNTHFPMSDLNNLKVAKLLEAWLAENGLDAPARAR